MAGNDNLAYGDFPSQDQSGEGERSLVDDAKNWIQGNQGVSTFLNKFESTVKTELERFSGKEQSQRQGQGEQHRFESFVGPRESNDVKWYVDGCGYFYAVSIALQEAKESVWILDWWLSPELYLRRPPAKNQQYRLDRMLQSACERGVKVNVIVYKEVPQALSLDSEYTKHYLEKLHPNVSVFRHPDHLPDAQTLQSSIMSSLEHLSLNAAAASKLGGDALKGLYGVSEDIILYWAHHEKLCLIDGRIAFMGGLDMCYGRWDTNQHSIADAHPSDLNAIVFPGQDFNNARIMDFADVSHWEQNKLDRKDSSRMGWSDVSICVRGPVVEDFKHHFVQRWNFIYDEKYNVRKDIRYHRLGLDGRPMEQQPYAPQGQQQYGSQGQQPQIQGQYPPSQYQNPPDQHKYQPYRPPNQSDDGSQLRYHAGNQGSESYMQRMQDVYHEGEELKERFERRAHQAKQQFMGPQGGSSLPRAGPISCQLVRSASKWSNGTDTEHSIANAYANIIRQANHFIYIENQFFITATGTKQNPVKNNLIGSALVERILRAARSGQDFKVICVIPAIPGFAGDLKEDASLGTRAIMEYQYNSINRGGHSIMEEISNAGFDPLQFIRWYNLRNYDRINTSSIMREVEQRSGVDYEDARRAYDRQYDPVGYDRSEEASHYPDPGMDASRRYQQAASEIRSGMDDGSKWDTVAGCYMLRGQDIRQVPWNGQESELDAFVQEELYIHSKIMIADDRTVVCGSANCNDRSMLGYHDSEIALVIEDPEPLDSHMGGRPFKASRFASSLRRFIMRKHLGLVSPQDPEQPNKNFMPAGGTPNAYDWGSPEDHLVADPLAPNFLNFWNGRARTNTEAFRQVFHAVPDDSVKTWDDYNNFYERYFHDASEVAGGKKAKGPSEYKWGHVVAENFSPGEQGVREVKDALSTIKGTLVEMPLLFLIKEDIAKEGISLNALTEEVYT